MHVHVQIFLISTKYVKMVMQVAVFDSFGVQPYIQKHVFSLDMKRICGFNIAHTFQDANDRAYRLPLTIAILSIILMYFI